MSRSSAEKVANIFRRSVSSENVLLTSKVNAYSREELERMTYKDVLKLAKKSKLQSRGKKKDLVESLVAYYTEHPDVGEDRESNTEETSGHSSKSRKKKWGTVNPLKVPPDEYHEDVFRANFPLVNIIEVEEGQTFPIPDKFEGPVLKHEVKKEARRKWIRRCMKADEYFGRPVSEGGGHQKHFAMFEDLGDFTRIAAHEVTKVNKFISAGVKRKWVHVEEPEETEANSGIHILDESDGQGLMPRNKGIHLVEQGRAQLRGDVACPEAVTGFADGILYVWDYRVKKRKGNDGSSIVTKRVAGILERKWVDDIYKFNAYYQGGFHAVKHCLVNLSNGHGTPVYILVMTGDYWSYAQLVPHGYVQSRNGRIDLNSMDAFIEHLNLTGQAGMSYEELQKKLDKGTQFLRKHYPDGPNLNYNDEPQLVGTLYICSEWFHLPCCHLGGFNNPDVDRLFDGLMRLVLGDSVLDLSREEFEKILTRRKEFTEELCTIYDAQATVGRR